MAAPILTHSSPKGVFPVLFGIYRVIFGGNPQKFSRVQKLQNLAQNDYPRPLSTPLCRNWADLKKNRKNSVTHGCLGYLTPLNRLNFVGGLWDPLSPLLPPFFDLGQKVIFSGLAKKNTVRVRFYDGFKAYSFPRIQRCHSWPPPRSPKILQITPIPISASARARNEIPVAITTFSGSSILRVLTPMLPEVVSYRKQTWRLNIWGSWGLTKHGSMEWLYLVYSNELNCWFSQTDKRLSPTIIDLNAFAFLQSCYDRTGVLHAIWKKCWHCEIVQFHIH